MLAPMLAVLLLAPRPATGPATAASARVEIEDALCAYAVVDFDRATLDEARLQALMRLWEGKAGSWIAELSDVSSSPWFRPLDEVKEAIPRMEAVLARFDAEMKRLAPPASLEPVVRWTRLQLEFDLWRVQAELDWCVTENPEALRRKFRELDPATRCASQIEEVSAKWFGKCKAGAFEWGNCVNDAFDRRYGRTFPTAAWEAFLRASRIKLTKVQCDEP